MRHLVVGALAALCVAIPALAQPAPASKAEVDRLDNRVDKLEGEMRAVQRKVFPGGNTRFFEPEFPAQGQAPTGAVAGAAAAAPAADAAARLQVRISELEKQLGQLTGRIETLENRQRVLEETLKKFQGDAEFRLGKLETAAVPLPPAPIATPSPAPAPSPAPKPAPTGVEAQYRAAYALFEAKDYTGAEKALSEWLSRNDKHPLASNAQFWLGRTHMAQREFGKAARSYLEGYNKYPKGERAADSLLGLGDALVALGKPQDACAAYNEMQAVFPDMRAELRPRLAAARTKAKCN
jgi:tol-pal system protein YbgF